MRMESRTKLDEVMDSSEFTLSSATEPDFSGCPSSPEQSMKKITKHLLQRKQMAHDMQVMKIELSQRTLTLENLKAEFSSKEDELQEKIDQLQLQKKLLQSKLDTELDAQRSASRQRQEATRREFESALEKQRQLEEANWRLIDKAADLKRQLSPEALTLNAEQYAALRAKPERDLSVPDFVAIRVFEATLPAQQELEQLRARLKDSEADRRVIGEERANIAEGYSRERELHQSLQEEYQRTVTALADTKALVQHGNFKVQNFDAVRDARDRLDSQVSDIRERYRQLSSEHDQTVRDRDDLERELGAARQAVTLLTQDKEYLTRQGADMAVRLGGQEDRMALLTKQLEETKAAREELYEKYVNSREDYKSQYESRLQDELAQLRLRTDSELERLRSTTETTFERENRSLREQRDEAATERDKSEARFRELSGKYEALQRDLHSMQASADSRIAELLSDSKLKAFEAERTALMLEENRSKLRDTELQLENLHAKLEVATKQYYELEARSGQRLAELETRVEEQRTKLHSYEAVEAELDGVVMEAAEKCEEEDINMERVTFTFAAGANLPSSARRRMQHSVQLARRVLALERRCRELQREVEAEKTESEQAKEAAEKAEKILSEAQQPYGYLVETLRSRDDQLARVKEQLTALEGDLRVARREKAELQKTKNAMSADLEKLLSQREELQMLRQLMTELKEQRTVRKQQAESRRRSTASGDAPRQPVAPECPKSLKIRSLEDSGRKPYGVYYS